jgi:two-component system response regulator ResD
MAKILIVDDNEGIRKFVSVLLQRAGYETIEAQDGEAALIALTINNDIDVLLLDVMMPQLTGIDILKRLEKYRAEKEIKVCMMTAKNQSQDISECLSLGADDYIVKPIEKDNLVEKVYQLINNTPKTSFFRCKVESEAKILTPKSFVTITLKNVSEYEFEFTSKAEIPINVKAVFQSELFSEVLKIPAKVFARIYKSYNLNGEIIYKASFIGFTESQTKLMRAATITKAIAHEEREE